MRKLLAIVLVSIVAVAAWQQQRAPSPLPDSGMASGRAAAPVTERAPRASAGLPREVAATLARIATGGPFEHAQDGAVFGNYEGLLPKQPRGYYHEYTVETSGARTRGARRIITGGEPPVAYYYTADHYRSFSRIEGPR